MSALTIDMSAIYDLLALYQRIMIDARGLNREEKERFVKLTNRAQRERWAERVMGGEDVLPSLIATRDIVKKRLGA